MKTSHESEKKVQKRKKTTGKWDPKKKEEKKPFNFKEEMKIVCKCLELTHRHRAEEQIRMERLIKLFGKKKKWLDIGAKMEDDHRKTMMRKFDEDLKLHFQEEVEKQKLKAAQLLREEEEKKLEEEVKQLAAEHGVSEMCRFMQGFGLRF